MPINAHPEYIAAEGEYLKAQSLEEKIEKLKKMISFAPSHKGGENLRAQLKTRLKKLLEQQEKTKKSGKSRSGIKKHELQCVLVGKTNSGKSSLLKILTNANPKISENEFSTKNPEVGIMDYHSAQIQIIEIPAINSENYDKGLVYTSDIVLALAPNFEDLNYLLGSIKTLGKIIIVMTKSDKLSENEKRKFLATLNSKYKKYESILFSNKSKENLNELKEKIFHNFNICRVYTKEPGQQISEDIKKRPMILPPNSTIFDVAEKILNGFSKKVKQIRIWGPSSKFPGQIVGLKHKIKDSDIVEFKTN
jgi:ribosome-interacting GTPase 1